MTPLRENKKKNKNIYAIAVFDKIDFVLCTTKKDIKQTCKDLKLSSNIFGYVLQFSLPIHDLIFKF